MALFPSFGYTCVTTGHVEHKELKEALHFSPTVKVIIERICNSTSVSQSTSCDHGIPTLGSGFCRLPPRYLGNTSNTLRVGKYRNADNDVTLTYFTQIQTKICLTSNLVPTLGRHIYLRPPCPHYFEGVPLAYAGNSGGAVKALAFKACRKMSHILSASTATFRSDMLTTSCYSEHPGCMHYTFQCYRDSRAVLDHPEVPSFPRAE